MSGMCNGLSQLIDGLRVQLQQFSPSLCVGERFTSDRVWLIRNHVFPKNSEFPCGCVLNNLIVPIPPGYWNAFDTQLFGPIKELQPLLIKVNGQRPNSTVPVL